ncbi:MAG TPA: MFS transporter [Methanobacterium sp.]|nr:MFS transporter [Methanobacterium sp.]
MMITSLNQKKTALLLVALGSFLIPFMGSSLSIALPLIGKDLTGSVILLSWLPTVFVLANTAFLLPFGKLADIHGRKRIFTYGVVIYTAASLLAALAPSITLLIFGSFLQGFGCSLIFATAVALLSSVYPYKHRGEALGIFITSVYIGLFLGPILGGFLGGTLGWRSIFLFNVPLGLFLLSLIVFKLKGEWKGSPDDKFDWKGAVIYVPSLIALMYGFTALRTTGGLIIFILGVAGFLIFILQETRISNPLLKIREFRKRSTLLAAGAMLFVNIATTAMWTLLSLYLQYLLALSPQVAALILSSQPLMVALFSPLVGRLSDKDDNRIFTISGTLLITLGLLVLSGLNQHTEIWLIILGLVMVGVGLALFSPPATNIFMGCMKKENYGMASATLSTMVYAGQTLSLGILLFILAVFLGNVQLNPSNFNLFLESLKTAFTIFAVFSALGLLVSFFLGKYDDWKTC